MSEDKISADAAPDNDMYPTRDTTAFIKVHRSRWSCDAGRVGRVAGNYMLPFRGDNFS
jgi:hypothetical protein